jgi:hypothetical protein
VAQHGVVPADRDERGEVETDGVAHDVEALPERGVEDVEAIVEAGCHPDVLRATTGEHERHGRRVASCALDGRAAAVLAAQLDDRVGDVGGDHDAAVRHRPPAVEQRGCDVGEVDVRVRLQMRRQPIGRIEY